MKKVGIMTWYQYENYGSVLQASALYNIIKSFGYQPDLIQYKPRGNSVDHSSVNILYIIKKAINKLHSLILRPFCSPIKSYLFKEYLSSSVSETRTCNTFPELFELNPEYDAFVCGSDQIWSPLCFDEKYFLSFVSDPQKMIAYAPSIGINTVTNCEIRDRMKALIKRFDSLSVREKQGAKLINSICGKDAKVVLDPTLLLDSSSWEKYLEHQNVKRINGNYIICYFLGNYRKYNKYVNHISKFLKMPAYIIPAFQNQFDSEMIVPFDVGPREFVFLIHNARYVCTDSFHGTTFALNFGVPFTVFKRFRNNDSKNQNSRITSLLSILNLMDRLADPNSKPDKQLIFAPIPSNARLILEKKRIESLEWLKSALCSVTQAGGKVNKINCFQRNFKLCCGCGACAASCPAEAISVTKNDEGFDHYLLDPAKCIHCGKCEQVCPFVHITASSMKNVRFLCSLKSTHPEVLAKSSSGGAAFEIAQFCNSVGYCVCGSTYDAEQDIAKHILIRPNQPELLPLLQGSKYIQSVSANAMIQISKLSPSEKLLFFGTPCQVAGVDKIYRDQGRRENVLLIDLICHGIPSQWVWTRHLEETENNYRLGIHPFAIFRDKSKGWKPLRLLLRSTKKNTCFSMAENKDDFYAIFRRGLCNMESCFECPYREKSAADIRIGDYWGPRFQNDNAGVSMVTANTDQGVKVLQQLTQKNCIQIEQHPIEEYWSVQFPYNANMPLFRKKMINQIIAGKLPLSKIRKTYCASYDLSEKVVKTINTIKMPWSTNEEKI